jgi:hypothetical protein
VVFFVDSPVEDNVNNLKNLGNRISVPIQSNEDGYTGRECPSCEGYFTVTFGTGLKGEGLPCHCPYCGHTEEHDQFWTQEQIEYAESVAMRQVMQAVHQDLKSMEFDIKPRGMFGIGMSMKFKSGSLPPIRYYREKELETAVLCETCTLKYMIYGVFAFCPDCKTHNSLQILNKNLELAEKQVALAIKVEADLSDHLIADALENAVSSFDGFGREACRVNAAKAGDPAKAEKLSFQNPSGARTNVQQIFGKDFAQNISPQDWDFLIRCFQKRHLLAHKMGVVDESYLRATGDTSATEGRKAQIVGGDVQRLAQCLRQLGQELINIF